MAARQKLSKGCGAFACREEKLGRVEAVDEDRKKYLAFVM